ncbi:unnamed protein product [Penicillium nalgiovense]|uniref:NmrA-like domain-containing protein n=1 Tax=Penicillium nalgiovense TaxID=60175 RepID=A0A9W4I765_PENNA|nr:unnamed protein product [Penicillium nalgiovense]CAG7942311.1 unnamed protein product [Penicillium nalgiovense]CAG7942462.1 unnamed protein product [Penicillium nalgiovense]CAG7953254.1 unnamed protein product [Penicillium nalgiovense]CAG7974158.1 unnamed protein product [Penicillium nalgiovense]
MEVIRNVAIAGASGALGSPILNALLKSELFNVTVLARQSSQAQFPASVKVVRVDYNSVPDLTAALTGQNAVVSVLTTSAMETQIPLIEAAMKAGVRRYLPSEFCANIGNPKAASLPVYHSKLAIHEAIKQQARDHPHFTYTLIRNGPFLDWSMAYGFFFSLDGGSTPFYDGGDRPFSTTTLATIGRAVVEVLRHSEETRNRAVFVQDLVTTQRKMLAIAQKVAPDCKWTPSDVSTADMEIMARDKYANGMVDLAASMGFFCRSVFGEGYGGEFQEVDNELLGIPLKTDADLEELIRGVLSGQKST